MIDKKNIGRITFVSISIFVIIGTLFYSDNIFKELAIEESQKVSLFAEAVKSIESPDNELGLYLKVIKYNETVPILMFDASGKLLQARNLELSEEEKQMSEINLVLKKGMNSTPVIINIGNNTQQKIYYASSRLLRSLQYFPYIQLILILLLFSIGYFFYANIKNAEQNKVWAGLSKETAHQLGTPISSLLAWIELMKSQENSPKFIDEIQKDVMRLKIVSDRFSNIGSEPTIKRQNIMPLIEETVNYMNFRTSSRIKFYLDNTSKEVWAFVNKELFNWVIENLLKNGVDAIGTEGSIHIYLSKDNNKVNIDITDTGKGIPSNLQEKIFSPGYTTKMRGWGLGLSLTKRIIKDYHNGRIFVKNSEIGKGTTFRIQLPNTI